MEPGQLLSSSDPGERDLPMTRPRRTVQSGVVSNPNDQATVRVVDNVVLPSEQVEPWLARWRADYLPGARARGMSMAALARRYAGPETVAVHITWDVPGIYEFYGMRGAAAADPDVARFWSETDAVAVGRERRVFESLEGK